MSSKIRDLQGPWQGGSLITCLRDPKNEECLRAAPKSTLGAMQLDQLVNRLDQFAGTQSECLSRIRRG